MRKTLAVLVLILAVVSVKAGEKVGTHWLWSVQLMSETLTELETRLQVRAQREFDDKYLFKLPDGNLFVGISLGECEEGHWSGKWKVKKNVIVDLLFYPSSNQRRKPKFYQLPSKGMDRDIDNGHRTFRTEVSGIYYSVLDGNISGIHLFPSTRYAHLRCES